MEKRRAEAFERGGSPGVAHGIVEIHAAAARDCNQRIGLRRIAVELHRLEMESGERAHYLQMTELLGSDVHQQIFALEIVAIEALNRVLHRCRELTVGSAELFEQHVSERRVWLIDPDHVHQLVDVVKFDLSQL